ncbi:MAG: NAD(P)H-binding protein [Cyanobacteria bacterium]|nr:NAD(P)H-binding protein [Cyanobacteriota bacterium]
MNPTEQEQTVIIDGATGYLGSHLTDRMLARGFKVNCLVHSRAKNEDVSFLSSRGAQCLQADLDADEKTRKELISFFQKARCAVHLIGSIAPKKGESFLELHAGMARRFVSICAEAGVEKIIMVTALGTDSGAKSEYHRSKWKAEQEVVNSGIKYTILRPSLLVGRRVGKRDSKLVIRLQNFIDNKKFVPLVAGGKGKIQPLYIGDMVDALIKTIDSSYDGATMELGRPDIVTMRQLVMALGTVMGKEKPIVDLPPAIARLAAQTMEMIQDVPTLSRDQVLLSLSDNICQDNRLPAILGREGTTLKMALTSYGGEGDRFISPEPVGSREER